MSVGSPEPSPSAPAPLEITEIRINPQNANALLAFVSVTFNDCFVVRGLKIIDGMEGRFVAMPARKKRDNTFQDVAHPITREFRAQLETAVLGAYRDRYESGEVAPSDVPTSEETAHPEAARAVVNTELG